MAQKNKLFWQLVYSTDQILNPGEDCIEEEKQYYLLNKK
jgi:hypothetical protein